MAGAPQPGLLKFGQTSVKVGSTIETPGAPDSYGARLAGDRLRSATTFPYMESECDPESEANAAMKHAVGAHGLERQTWFNLAIAWRELARARPVQQLDKTNVEAA